MRKSSYLAELNRDAAPVERPGGPEGNCGNAELGIPGGGDFFSNCDKSELEASVGAEAPVDSGLFCKMPKPELLPDVFECGRDSLLAKGAPFVKIGLNDLPELTSPNGSNGFPLDSSRDTKFCCYYLVTHNDLTFSFGFY